MVLCVDIGNTNIVFGCFLGDQILFRERMSTNVSATDLEYASVIRTALDIHGLSSEEIDGAVISSVVPSVTNTVRLAIEKYAGVKALVVGPGIKTGLKITIDDPAQLGSDLVVDAVAGINYYPVPQIIIDMGTATTFSVIDKDKNYVGTLITAGVSLSAQALSDNTSQLPNIAFDAPSSVIGKNTVSSMKNGLLYSCAGAIDGIVQRIEDELGQSCSVIATGGLCSIVAPLCRCRVHTDDELLLKGLMIIYNKNK